MADDQDGQESEGKDKKKEAGEEKEKKDGGKDAKEKDGKDEKPKTKWPIIIAVVIFVIALIAGFIYWFATRNQESTDDAYTEGNAISIAPKVSGYIVEDHINDNVSVHRGDLMLRIDPRDYIAARDQAKANLDSALAELADAKTQLEISKVRAPADLVEAQSQLVQARAAQIQAQRDYDRQQSVDPRATTQTNVDQATTTLQVNAARRRSAQAQLAVAALVPENISAAEATVAEREAQVEQARAALAQAELNLSYTEIRAPEDGFVTRRNVDPGTYAQAGQQVFYLVTIQIWVVANFKETQLDRMRVGQRVNISVDAYPHLKLTGHVESIQAGSGARFTAFPAENATGNFVKIVRRVPVKILIDHGLDNFPFLPLGLSVEPTVYFK